MTARRAVDAALALLFALPLASLWTEPSASLTLRLFAAAVLVLTALRPGLGLCLAAALLPISPALHAKASGNRGCSRWLPWCSLL